MSDDELYGVLKSHALRAEIDAMTDDEFASQIIAFEASEDIISASPPTDAEITQCVNTALFRTCGGELRPAAPELREAIAHAIRALIEMRSGK